MSYYFYKGVSKTASEENENGKKYKLFLQQKELLDTFALHGAISRAQYEKSLNGLKEKMGFDIPDSKENIE